MLHDSYLEKTQLACDLPNWERLGKDLARLGMSFSLQKKTLEKLSKFLKNLKSVGLSFCILAESMSSLAESVLSLVESGESGRVLAEYLFSALTRQDSGVLASL